MSTGLSSAIEKLVTEHRGLSYGYQAGAVVVLAVGIGSIWWTRDALTASVFAPQEKLMESMATSAEAVTRFAKDLDSGTTKPSQEMIGIIGNINNTLGTISSNWTALYNAGAQPYLTTLLVTLVTRAAIALLILYLVQFLFRLARYHRLLATHFQARAAVFGLVAKPEELPLAELLAAVSVESIDIGRAPRPPSRELADMVRLMGESARAAPAKPKAHEPED